MSPSLRLRPNKPKHNMASYSIASVELVRANLFKTEAELVESGMGQKNVARIKALRAAFNMWTADPRLTDNEILHFLRDHSGKGLHACYNDLWALKAVIGDVAKNSKDYDRYLFRLKCEEGWEMARQKEDARAFAAVTAAFGKYTNLDKEEKAAAEFDKIVPAQFVIVADPSAAGFNVPDDIMARAKRLERKLKREAGEYVEPIEETSN